MFRFKIVRARNVRTPHIDDTGWPHTPGKSLSQLPWSTSSPLQVDVLFTRAIGTLEEVMPDWGDPRIHHLCLIQRTVWHWQQECPCQKLKKNNTWYTWHISAFLTNHSLRILKISFLAALVSTPPHQESAGSEFGASTGAPEDQGRRFGKALRHHLHLGPWDGHGMPWGGRCHKKPLDGSGVLLISVVSS